ncbi:MAG: arsenate reductase family protein [Eggerthellaceae bacterium]
MNIQIFGINKSQDTRKAQRWFKERRIKFQFVDLKDTDMSKGEMQSVARAVGGVDALIDWDAKDQDLVALMKYLQPEARAEKLLENQHVMVMPVVRNGRQATVGYAPKAWESWE